MANYTFLSITAYGIQENINEFDINPPNSNGSKIEIKSDGDNRVIFSEFPSSMTTIFIEEIIHKIKGLSLFIDVEIEPGYVALLHKSAFQTKPIKIFEIDDFRDDDHTPYLDKNYLDKFDRINPSSKLTEILRKSHFGNIYLNLL